MNRLRTFTRNLTMQKKIFITGSLIIVSFLLIVFGYLFPGMNSNIIEMKKIKLKEITKTGISIVHYFYGEVQNGNMTEKEAKRFSLEALRKIRYGPENKDYIWINDFHPRMLMHPYVKKLEGKDLSKFKDPEGIFLFKEMVHVCTHSGEGYVSYMWQWKDQKEKIVPKISFVKSFNPWGWIIGTGLYVHDARSEIGAIQSDLKNRLIAIFVGVSLVLFFLLFRLAKTISRPVQRILHFSDKLAEGNLRERISVNGKDELGMLSLSLNNSADHLENLFVEIKQKVDSLNQRIEAITEDNLNLSQRVTSQASTVEEISSTVEESNTSMRLNMENVSLASKVAEKSLVTAGEGGEKINNTIDSISRINESSDEISKILSAINEIAFQTNLLSLNASIEAARAGEEGRGFAVVASEVRSLAGRSAGAASNIGSIIQGTIELIQTGVLQVKDSKESLGGIIQEAEHVMELVSEISTATLEQINGMEQIRQALHEMDQFTQENVVFVDKTAQVGQEMAEQAKNLIAMVNRFEIRESAVLE